MSIESRATASPRLTGGLAYWSPELRPVEAEALAFLEPLSDDYPNIQTWYRSKVVPGLRTGSRTLVRIERAGQLVGLGIGKSEPGERKICTVRVAPSHFGRGIGMRIFDALLRWLDVDRPHLTVSDGKRPAFDRIFEYYRFTMTSAHEGLYVPNALELAYNEPNESTLIPHLGTDSGRFAQDMSEVQPLECKRAIQSCWATPEVSLLSGIANPPAGTPFRK